MDKSELKRYEDIFLATQKYMISMGLEVPDVMFEVVSKERIIEAATYGFPANFSHPSFGSTMDMWKSMSDLQGGKFNILEVVFNDPKMPLAFLLDTNSFTENAMVIPHVCGHVDFFRKNVFLSDLNFTDVANKAASARQRFSEYMLRYGEDHIMDLITSVLSIAKYHMSDSASNYLDIRSLAKKEKPEETRLRIKLSELRQKIKNSAVGSYEKTTLGSEIAGLNNRLKQLEQSGVKDPSLPEYDLLSFFITNSPLSEKDYVVDIMETIRLQWRYIMTVQRVRMLNEGWASFWHYAAPDNLMDVGLLTSAEVLEMRARHDTLVTTHRKSEFNDYAIGAALYRYLKSHHDKIGKGSGLSNILQVRELYSDGMAVRNLFSDEFIRDMELFEWEDVKDAKGNKKRVVVSKDPVRFRRKYGNELAMRGVPVITVQNSNFKGNGTLYLKHHYTGFELDPKREKVTLAAMYRLWLCPIWLETFKIQDYGSDGSPVLSRVYVKYDGKECKEKDSIDD